MELPADYCDIKYQSLSIQQTNFFFNITLILKGTRMPPCLSAVLNVAFLSVLITRGLFG